MVWTLFFFHVIYANVNTVAGWTYHEVLFLVGLNIVVFQLLLALFYVWSLRILPERIAKGDIDMVLVKPLHSLFSLTFAQPYVASLLSVVPGFFLMGYALIQIGTPLQLSAVLVASIIVVCGMSIAYCCLVILSSLSFIFINAHFLPEVAVNLLGFAQNPHTVYASGLLRLAFFIIIPVVFIASIPTSVILKGINWWYLVSAIGLAVSFWIVLIRVWQSMISRYSSASS